MKIDAIEANEANSKKRSVVLLQLVIGSLMIGITTPLLLAGVLFYFTSAHFDEEVRRHTGMVLLSSGEAVLAFVAITACFVVVGGVLVFLSYRSLVRSRHSN